MTDVDRQIERSSELLHRLSPQAQRLAHRARQRKRAFFIKKIGRVIMAGGAILIASVIFGLAVGPIGSSGFLVALGLFIAAALLLLIYPQYPEASTETLVNTDLKYLPAQTEVWLSSQRKALPAPAANQLDQIGLRLETLGPQLQTLDPREPAAQEVRKILTEHLPDLVNGYKRVPETLRRERQSNGQTPDQQLTEGLKLIDEEIAEMTRNIAAGDLDSLATQGKFLELKYRDPEGMRD
ncbi:hypothetical protein [Sphingomonas colocasiae]|uniref:5-bromo-4-chloroindolyl phosphate hydrolase n=1 Tax=Sphingomonas colocasiae TaxID=1848973 RepID=A0ABS7PX62_9SPHN|nr:hypothetical protein [Sphingomonas colocasiae]MBY8825876.1 hypothetical protein [Sphingomonas colocasiae]